ncbi:MAG: hypothetical protein AAGC54_12120 [Cyanobacteria bacterium P01_F01_bin.4]
MATSTNTPPRNTQQRTRFAWYKVGAIAYILWGIWHLQIVAGLWQLGSTLSEPAGVGVRIQQGAFHILFFVLCAIAIGFLNWRNSRIGYWINLITIGWTEIGLFWLFMLPGTFPWLPKGWIGPALWVIAVAFTTAGQLQQTTTK